MFFPSQGTLLNSWVALSSGCSQGSILKGWMLVRPCPIPAYQSRTIFSLVHLPQAWNTTSGERHLWLVDLWLPQTKEKKGWQYWLSYIIFFKEKIFKTRNSLLTGSCWPVQSHLLQVETFWKDIKKTLVKIWTSVWPLFGFVTKQGKLM